MKKTETAQFNVRVSPTIARQLQALAKLRGVSQGRLIEQLAKPAIERLAVAQEIQR